MKGLFFLFYFLLAVSVKGQTNVYHPFPDSDAVWNVEAIFSYGYGNYSCPGGPEYDFYSYIINGDTLINSISYHKLYVPYWHPTGSFMPCWKPVWIAGYKGAIRQDIIRKKIWIVMPDSTTEYILYDFNVLAGDSYQTIGPCGIFGVVIDSIDSILIGGSYRKKYNINGSQFFIIEGIGSTRGLLESQCYSIPFGEDIYLTCFKQSSIALYPDTATSCNVILSVATNLSPKNIFLTLFPNPFRSTATLEITGLTPNPSPKERGEELRIYDAMGRLVRQQIITNNTEIINRGNLSDGLYFYQLRTKDYELSGKFVVE